jgi:hypothetical protein
LRIFPGLFIQETIIARSYRKNADYAQGQGCRTPQASCVTHEQAQSARVPWRIKCIFAIVSHHFSDMPNYNQSGTQPAQTSIGRSEWVYRLTRIIARLLLAPFFRVVVSGLENLPAESAFILLPKHQRWEDIPLLTLATPRRLYYVAKHELFKNPLGSWYVTSLGGIGGRCRISGRYLLP